MKIHKSLGLLFPALLAWLTFAPGASGGVTLVPMGSVWKYLDNGTYPGAAWTSPLFNDSTWLSGPAQLGYGEGDEATVVSSGPDPNNKYITTYFRHPFVVTNAASYTNFTLRLLRDDGAVVYLNGLELVRVSMPAGPVTPQSPAANAAIEGSLFVTPFLGPGVLVEGLNTLAVEIHQVSAVSSDISFDLELVNGESMALTDFLDVKTNDVFAAPANLSLTAKAVTQGGVTNVKFYVNGAVVAEKSMYNRLYGTLNRQFDAATNYTLAISAHDNRGFSKTSVVDLVVEPMPDRAQTVSLVSTGAQWKYLDSGSNLGTAWQLPDYDDAAWDFGAAVLGHGRPGIATPTRAGTFTTFFRHAFEVPAPSLLRGLALRVLRADGTRVYLNGTDVFRNNLPSDPVTFATRALEALEPTNYISGPLIDSSLLVTGRNVLAVEMHLVSTNAPRLAFDLELLGLPAPRLSIRPTVSGNALFAWPYPSTGFRLMETPSLSQPAWTDVTNPLPMRVGQECQVPAALPSDTRFYRLRKD